MIFEEFIPDEFFTEHYILDIWESGETLPEIEYELNYILNNTFDDWEKVKVLTSEKIEHVNDLEELIVRKYEYRYRLYLQSIYRLLGSDKIIDKNIYWEKKSLEDRPTFHEG